MKQLTGFTPIAALPESTAASLQQRLIATIHWLDEQGAASETNLNLLIAIAQSILWSEESYARFLQCGFDAAIELFDSDVKRRSWVKQLNLLCKYPLRSLRNVLNNCVNTTGLSL
ncbi:hypothetical protein [Dendronalium sp. ChiSLP03b]|uniref:hypothetical protein n=1 Tax=Dendronalium sp. ChiSLP03b TaxID=3075381 RepID=UPI0039190B45